jgi:hypothetical protein
MKSINSTVLLVLFSILFSTAFAQNNGRLSGYVRDVFGEPLEGATIVLINTDYGTITDKNGYFVLESIPPNNYSLEVRFLGYSTFTRYNILIQSTGTQDLNIELLPQLNQLDGVELKDYFNYRKKETPLSTQTLSAVEIANYPGGNNDVVRVAQSLPGVAPSIGGFRNDLIIRGGAPNEVVYFMDGIELTAINHFSTQGSSGGPAGMLNVSFIDEVTLNTSSFLSSTDNALSGVLNFKQREAPTDKKHYNIRVGASETALTFMGPITDTAKENPITAIASVRRSYLQFLFQLIGLPIRPDYWDYQFKITKKIDQRNEINIIGLGSIDEFSVEAPETDLLDQLASAQQVPFIEQNTNNIGVNWKRQFSKTRGNSLLSLSYNNKLNNFSRYNDNVNQTGLLYSHLFDEHYFQLRYNASFYIDKYKLVTGGNIKNITYHHQLETALNNYDFESLNFFQNGVYTQASTSYFDNKLDVSAGFRLDHTNYNQSNQTALSPRMSLSYHIGAKSKINSSIGRYFKLPPLTVLGYQENNTLVNSNNFEFTQSDHFVLGYESYLDTALLFSIEGFYKKYSNYPVSINDNVSLANKGGDFEILGDEAVDYIGRGISYGMELMLQQKFIDRGYGILSYTYFHSLFDNGTNEFLPSAWDSRHLVSFTGGYALKKNWNLSMRYRFAGKTPFAVIDTEKTLENYPIISYDYQSLKTSRLKNFSQMDIRIDKKWNNKRNTIDFYMELQNALKSEIPQAPQYALISDDNQNPVLVNASSDSKKIIPTIGFVIDF